jgi:NAD(P)-dependent dehydrogenase (short-subunit alcohol dehydrogenase family)
MQVRTVRVALVTGANKGIGCEIARQIGKAEDRVLLGARNAARRGGDRAARDGRHRNRRA